MPVSKGGHPSDIDNLQLAHPSDNRAKADKTAKIVFTEGKLYLIVLPQSLNWANYKPYLDE